jgi:hypothetical protein
MNESVALIVAVVVITLLSFSGVSLVITCSAIVIDLFTHELVKRFKR